MHKLSGLVLDLYDDTRADVLKNLYPSLDVVPEVVKTAHLLSPEELSRLPDDAFALILVDGDVSLRKYACIDPGNTLLSLLYFEKMAHKLPMHARERALENFEIATGWYWQEPESLEKAAGIMGSVIGGAGSLLGRVGMGAIKNPGKALTTGLNVMGGVGAAKQISSRLGGVNAAEQAAGGFGNIVG